MVMYGLQNEGIKEMSLGLGLHRMSSWAWEIERKEKKINRWTWAMNFGLRFRKLHGNSTKPHLNNNSNNLLVIIDINNTHNITHKIINNNQYKTYMYTLRYYYLLFTWYYRIKILYKPNLNEPEKIELGSGWSWVGFEFGHACTCSDLVTSWPSTQLNCTPRSHGTCPRRSK